MRFAAARVGEVPKESPIAMVRGFQLLLFAFALLLAALASVTGGAAGTWKWN